VQNRRASATARTELAPDSALERSSLAWAYSALPWLGVLLALALLVVLICYWPVRLEVSGRARGEADGSWVIAGGVSLAAMSVALVWGRGVGPRLTFLLFGRKLSWRPQWSQQLAGPVPKRVKAASQRLWSRVDPVHLGLKILEERRHLRLRYLVVDLAYGFKDPLLTGRLVGALAMLSAVLPATVELRQAPRWDFEDGWEVKLDSRAIVKPWLVLLDVAAYVVRQIIWRPASRPQPVAAPGPSE
jgi:hypothetical protein